MIEWLSTIVCKLFWNGPGSKSSIQAICSTLLDRSKLRFEVVCMKQLISTQVKCLNYSSQIPTNTPQFSVQMASLCVLLERHPTTVCKEVGKVSQQHLQGGYANDSLDYRVLQWVVTLSKQKGTQTTEETPVFSGEVTTTEKHQQQRHRCFLSDNGSTQNKNQRK